MLLTVGLMLIVIAWIAICLWQFGQLDASGKTSMSPNVLWWVTAIVLLVSFVDLAGAVFSL